MQKDYSVWVDKNEVSHNISEMTTTYIKNCMEIICRSYNPSATVRPTLSFEFVQKHGINYLESFSKELMKRECAYVNKKI